MMFLHLMIWNEGETEGVEHVIETGDISQLDRLLDEYLLHTDPKLFD